MILTLSLITLNFINDIKHHEKIPINYQEGQIININDINGFKISDEVVLIEDGRKGFIRYMNEYGYGIQFENDIILILTHDKFNHK